MSTPTPRRWFAGIATGVCSLGLAAALMPAAPADAAVVTIADIQGWEDESPMVGDEVTTRGVITAAYHTGGFDGIYMQTPGSGGGQVEGRDRSDGIFVYQPQGLENLEPGQCVDVTGTVGEYHGLTQLSDTTAVTAVENCDPVEPVTLQEWDLKPHFEGSEGMLVQPEGHFTITDNYNLNSYGSLGLASGDQKLIQTTDEEPGPAREDSESRNEEREITLDDGSSWDYQRNDEAKNSPLPYLGEGKNMRTGSPVSFTAPLILDYRYDSWNLQPTTQQIGADAPFLEVTDNREPAPELGGDVHVASFNVLNYFTDLGEDEEGCEAYTDREGAPTTAKDCTVRGAYSAEAFARQQRKIVAAINELDADVVGLMEIEDTYNVPASAGHQSDPDLALQELVTALNEAAGSEKWAAAEAPSTWTNTDVIRSAFIYQTDTVQPAGEASMLDDPAFHNARHPLAQPFAWVDDPEQTFVAVVNHFKSKGSGEDDGRGQGKANPDRIAQAEALDRWVTGSFDMDTPILLLGDFNAYSREDPVEVLQDGIWGNMPAEAGVTETTYQYAGRHGSLDHIFGNTAASLCMDKVTGTQAAVWSINADEPIAREYSRHNGNVSELFEEGPHRSSDHDPVVVALALQEEEPDPSPSPTMDPSPSPTADPSPSPTADPSPSPTDPSPTTPEPTEEPGSPEPTDESPTAPAPTGEGPTDGQPTEPQPTGPGDDTPGKPGLPNTGAANVAGAAILGIVAMAAGVTLLRRR